MLFEIVDVASIAFENNSTLANCRRLCGARIAKDCLHKVSPRDWQGHFHVNIYGPKRRACAHVSFLSSFLCLSDLLHPVPLSSDSQFFGLDYNIKIRISVELEIDFIQYL